MPQQRVPKALAAKYEEICRLTDAFCAKHLDAECAELSESIVVALCRKRPSPLTRGRANSWACGVVHALGMVNFLFDPDAPRHLPARQLYEGFGVSASSGGAKSRAVRSALSMGPLDPEWTLPSSMLDNPRVWMIMVDDLVVDVRDTPVEIQRAAYDQGLIPFVPSDPSYGDQA